MKVCLLSLGCKVNQAENSLLESALKGHGHEVVGIDETPEVCIINTCTVTAKSDYQSRQLIRRASRTGAKVIVTGCYAELNKEQVSSLKEVETVVENKNKLNIINMLCGNNASIALNKSGNRTRFFLKVQDGCNHSCSYCIIPKARGSSRSIAPSEVIAQVERAVAEGYKEVVLTGIHLGLYGNDINTSVSELVEEILDKTAIERIRLSSLEITEISDRLIRLFDDKRVCRHLHIPLQSGDDRILNLMNRNYDSAFFKKTILNIAERLPDIALGTDIIVGFPHEGETEFNNTFRLAEELPFTYIHVFPFSKRPGTKAALMPDTVGSSERKQRAAALRRLADRKRKEYMTRHIGKTLDVLIEEKVSNGVCRGTSSNYLKVHVLTDGYEKGSIVPVRIEAEEKGLLFGKPINKE
jgi:threonylcarbamoyladenosine tRNA methylthiotransferase MtaB